jgi:hypothetical protein
VTSKIAAISPAVLTSVCAGPSLRQGCQLRPTDPLKQREEILRRDHARLEKSMDRLLKAYQEGLISVILLR